MCLVFQNDRLHSTECGNIQRPEHDVHSSRALGWFWSTADCRRSFRCSQRVFRHQACASILYKPAFGTVANFTRPNGYRHRQVLLHLFARFVRLCLWFESTAVVFCRLGTAKMLPQTRRHCRLGWTKWCLHEMASLWKVRNHSNNKQTIFTRKFAVEACWNNRFTFSVCSNRHSRCFGLRSAAWISAPLNWPASSRTRVSGVFLCLVRTVWSM